MLARGARPARAIVAGQGLGVVTRATSRSDRVPPRAAHPSRVAAVAGFHPGFLVTDAPDSPHRLIRDLTAEVHRGLAEGDMSPEAIREFNQALDAAGADYATEVYPGTIHGFSMSDTDAFNPSALQRHWDRLIPLLDRTLAND